MKKKRFRLIKKRMNALTKSNKRNVAKITRRVMPTVTPAPASHLGKLSVDYLSNGSNGVAYLAKNEVGKKFVIKIPIQARRDNAVREYLVGLELNKEEPYYPAIVRTEKVYGFEGNGFDLPQVLQSLKPIGESIHDTVNIGDACRTAGHAVLFLQAVEGETLKTFRHDAHFAKHELLGVLMQVYYTLSMLRTSFTHHDLHCNNILVHQPKKGSSMLFRFMYNNPKTKSKEMLEIKCSYLAKIIDYGRMYCRKVTKMEDSEMADLSSACNQPPCGEEGSKCGFKFRLPGKHHYNLKNESQDLRLLKEVERMFGDFESAKQKKGGSLPPELLALCRRVEYGHGTNSKRFYTREQIRSPGMPLDRIFDMNDAIQALGTFKKENPSFQSELPVHRSMDIDGIHPYDR